MAFAVGQTVHRSIKQLTAAVHFLAFRQDVFLVVIAGDQPVLPFPFPVFAKRHVQ